ncbi:MAG: 2-dehydropantoate 2-reductase [Bacteroidales bacterium]|nr:2-dehydropantoate 2-reductase [Bacteroidales bacterium]
MNVLVVGIGGIGGYLGAKLSLKYANSGIHTISFMQRGNHKNAIETNGLSYIAKERITARPNAIYDSVKDLPLFDLVIFSVKAKDFISTAQSLKGAIHAETILLSTLNGVNNAKLLQEIFPENIILNGCIYVSASIDSPGVVVQKGGAGLLYFGSDVFDVSNYTFVEYFFKEAGIKCELTENITLEVWKKYFFICPFATVTSLYQMPIGAVLENVEAFDYWKGLFAELVILSKSMGVELEDNIFDAALERAKTIPYDTATSMQLDFQNGIYPEIDVFTGFVVEKSRELSLNVPFHNKAYDTLKQRI